MKVVLKYLENPNVFIVYYIHSILSIYQSTSVGIFEGYDGNKI